MERDLRRARLRRWAAAVGGRVVPREIPRPAEPPGTPGSAEELHRIRVIVVQERRLLSDVLSRWTDFLASSGDNESVLLHLADIALGLDRIRDAALEAEFEPGASAHSRLEDEIAAANELFVSLSEELEARLEHRARAE